jgi:hypothetical protein
MGLSSFWNDPFLYLKFLFTWMDSGGVLIGQLLNSDPASWPRNAAGASVSIARRIKIVRFIVLH